ncbi:glucokinase [Massilia cavernae]|uniref:Glucokinase n=1 Tax=Massilia cavernae TaxID=2320864 RepID=A0A418Y835_9BURK|nr:glucokinase [Massilia cavernae]RJG27186.1 glucokinase [Massilia cavernae]
MPSLSYSETLPHRVAASQAPRDCPRLLADIGGTNARFALESAAGVVEAATTLPCAMYGSIADAMRAFLAGPQAQAVWSAPIRHAAIAIANPVDGDQVRMTNHHWAFSIEAVRREMAFDTFVVVNDFTALAMALPYLAPSQKLQVGGGEARPDGVLGLVGAGTGLGISGLVPAGREWTPLASEGGHVTLSPADEREIAILRFAWREFGHVSAERMLSGNGLELIYRALAELRAAPSQALNAAEITQRAMQGACELAVETVDCFCAMMGTVAGNLALTLGATGGVYIGGGIVPRLGTYFANSGFRERFEQKGRFSSYLARIPVYVITDPYPAFIGTSKILADRLHALEHVRTLVFGSSRIPLD